MNSIEDQHYLADLIVSTLDAVEVKTGLDKAREYARQTPRFDHVWYWRTKLPERKGQRCRVVARGRMNSILVEFEDGQKFLTSRYAVREYARGLSEPVGAEPRVAQMRAPGGQGDAGGNPVAGCDPSTDTGSESPPQLWSDE